MTDLASDVLSSQRASALAEAASSRSSAARDEPKKPLQVQTEFSRGFGDWLIANQVGLVCSTAVDLRNGDIVHRFWLGSDITELFDVAVIPNIRCPRGIGPHAPGLEEAMRGEELQHA